MSNYSILNNSSNKSLDIENDQRIYFVAILRNEETLVKFSEYSGNFDELLEQILPKIFKTNGIKMTFNYEE